MGTLTDPAIEAKKLSQTPKAIIHQKFGDKAIYKVEEVEASPQNGCPGLAFPQKGPCLYRCCLQLPDFSVVSEIFKRKKDAEQAAAEKAAEKLGIQLKETVPSIQESWNYLAERLSFFFSSEFLASDHPLSGHFRVALRREGQLSGCVPVSVIATYDPKLNNLCKIINPDVESNPLLVMSIISGAAKLAGTLSSCKETLLLKSQTPHMLKVLNPLSNYETSLPENIQIRAVRIPASVENMVESLTLDISRGSYYLDVIAQELGVADCSEVLISRGIGKASSEMRLYFCFPDCHGFNQLKVEQGIQSEGSLNVRASYFSGQPVYGGDAILASVGYKWKSPDLYFEDVSLRSYYRTLIGKMPNGLYKLSRESILVAELPMVFTARSNWRGSLPKEILCTFCRQYRLSEPVFSMQINSLGAYKCEIKLLSKRQDLILQCSPRKAYKKQMDTTHNTSLKVLSWLNMFLRTANIFAEELKSFAEELEIQFFPELFMKEFALCPFNNCSPSLGNSEVGILDCGYLNASSERLENMVSIRGQDNGVNPSNGSLVCISYSVCLVVDGESVKGILESDEDFEFEIGSGAVVPIVENVVNQMSVGQSAILLTDLLPREIIFAAAEDFLTCSTLLSSGRCNLEYSIRLLRVTEPFEDRVEQAFFSPSLSKQRVEYALQHIRESCALSLVDFGCGSGSLLDSLLEYPTSLDKIAGVDISQKGLARAAKILHSKLNSNSDDEMPSNRVNSAVLYEGSITTFDSRLHGFDIGTCLEVIEHMEEDEASLFGDAVLSSFCPKILIISTPNYEYNVILQKSTVHGQDDDPDEKNQQQSVRFRNHDHKFEWTRSQFCKWATELAKRHEYSVEFSGVGGKGDIEPGFASQIAVFRKTKTNPVEDSDANKQYRVVWEWSKRAD